MACYGDSFTFFFSHAWPVAVWDRLRPHKETNLAWQTETTAVETQQRITDPPFYGNETIHLADRFSTNFFNTNVIQLQVRQSAEV
jgi:hypothetical protein